jgi:hypothetical protein
MSGNDPITPAAPAKPIVDYVEESGKKLKVIIAESESSVKSMSALLEGSVKKAFDGIAGIGKESIQEFSKVHSIVSENTVLFDKFTKNFIAFRELTKTKDLFSGLTNSTATFGMVTDQITAMGTEWGVLAKRHLVCWKTSKIMPDTGKRQKLK